MSIVKWFDELEDKVRARLSRRPLLYGFMVGIGSVLFFRGVWYLADEVPMLTGPVTLALALIILGLTGTLSSHFVSDRIIASGWKEEKKWEENLNQGVMKKEEILLISIEKELKELREEVKNLKGRESA